MAFIGNTPTTQSFTPAVDFFSGNGSTTAFTLSRPVASVAQVQAVIENVPQAPTSAFTVSSNTITFTSAPPSGTNNIYVYYTSPITQVIQPGQGTVGATQLVAGAALANIGTGGVTSTYLASGAARSNWGAGGVLQVVNATVTGDVTTSSTTYTSTGLFATITPSSTSSKIVCLTSSNVSYIATSTNALYGAFYRGTSGNGSGSAIGANPYYWVTASNGSYQPSQMMFVDSPASTSALTYTVMYRSANGNPVGWCSGFASANLATLILMEIAG